jgi:hypothetical protein
MTRPLQQIAVLHDLFNQINDRLSIIGETNDAYFLCQCIEILKQQSQTIDTKADKINQLQAEVEALRKDDKWIPVSERLPEPDIDVLCYLQFGSSHRIAVAGLFPIEMGAGLRSGIRSEWLEFSNPDSALVTVTHWKPLPQPPAIKGEAT